MEKKESSPLEISKDDFRRMGYRMIDSISEFIDGIAGRPVTTGETPDEIMKITGTSRLPENGSSPDEILSRASELLFNHSLLNGHPKFFGYITASAAPIGALADLLASAVNPNVGANILSPAATGIEKQTISWLAELVGVPSDYGGIMVSGGNVANFTGFLAATAAKATEKYKIDGVPGAHKRMVFYCSKATHTWVEKAAVLFGLGTGSIRWIDTDDNNKMDTGMLSATIRNDIKNGLFPFLVIGNAGDVSTGAIDNLEAIAAVCRKYDLWFHVDGAYGLPAAVIPELSPQFNGITYADSIALDPHKWLYCPLEAGCTLVKDPDNLRRAFSTHPVYYNFGNEDPSIRNYYEFGLQNSRGFRALKVWCNLQQVGRNGYEKLISHDILMSELLFRYAEKNPDLEAFTNNLSITTFRYKPADHNYSEERLNELNEKLLNVLQKGGELFLSNAVLKGKYCLRACIVNFRTSEKDIEETIEIIVREGRKIHAEWRKETLAEKIAEAGS